jgi:hypothetical protein
MKFLIVLALSAASLVAQSVGGGISQASSGGVGSGTAISGTPAATQSAQWTDATHVKGVAQGVFNARTMYGAVPDGSTDNATAIAAAFAATNAVTTGIPTVYFDCDTGTTTCQYNYGGSGTSPINPTVATTIQCAPGVFLNYTGTAHAVDLGSSGRTFQDELPYTVQGCTFTGAASSTHGIYVNAFITNTYILNNTFFQFGNRTGFNIYYAGNNWESLVQGNSWYDHDGVTRNILDGHNAAVHAVRIIGNNVECDTSGHAACSISTIGVGFWIGDQFKVSGNVIQYHAPLIRIANTATSGSDRPTIIGNHFEGNSGVATPAITYGDPGGTAAQLSCMEYSGNTMFYSAATGTPMVGPETPASGSYALSNCPFLNNDWSPAPSSGTYYVNTNSGSNNIWGRNQAAGTIITASASSPSVFDNNSRNHFQSLSKQGNGGALSGLASYQSDGQGLTASSFHNVAAPLLCADSSGSSSAQSCNTSPLNDINGAAITPVVGDSILYKTTTANTGDLTINVNSLGAVHVRKCQGNSTLAFGDMRANVPVLLTYDATYWEFQGVGSCTANFPNSGQVGSVVVSNYTAGAGAVNRPLSGAASVAGCSASGVGVSSWPTAGVLRNVVLTTAGTNGNVGIRGNIDTDCVWNTSGTVLPAPGGVAVLPLQAAGAYSSSWNEFWHVIQGSANGTAWQKVGQGAGTAAGVDSIAMEFVADSGTATSVIGSAQNNASLTASATTFGGFAGDTFSATELREAVPLPFAATVGPVTLCTSSGVPTNTETFFVNKNGANTALTFTIAASDAANQCYGDWTHTVNYAKGDYIDLAATTGASTTSGLGQWFAQVIPQSGSSTMLAGSWGGNTVTTTSNYSMPGAANNPTATQANAELGMPIACTAANLYVVQILANGGGVTTTFALQKNGVDTAITGTVTSGSGTGAIAVDTTHTASYVKGDLMTLRAVTGSGTSGTMGGWSISCN